VIESRADLAREGLGMTPPTSSLAGGSAVVRRAACSTMAVSLV